MKYTNFDNNDPKKMEFVLRHRGDSGEQTGFGFMQLSEMFMPQYLNFFGTIF